MIDLIEESPILKDGDSLSNYGVKENTQEKYAKICIVYKNNHGEVQNVWLNTFKGDVLHFCDSSGEEYQLSAKKTEQFIKAVKKLDKRQDEFHDYNLTALAYTSDGDVYHIKAGLGEYSENDIAIEGACYEEAENVVRLLEK